MKPRGLRELLSTDPEKRDGEDRRKNIPAKIELMDAGKNPTGGGRKSRKPEPEFDWIE